MPRKWLERNKRMAEEERGMSQAGSKGGVASQHENIMRRTRVTWREAR
jgi:hypothetical protein